MGDNIVTDYTCDRLYDYKLILGTMDVMWADISEDGGKEYNPNILDEYWIGMYADEEYLGMYRIHKLSAVLYEIHAFILPEQRKHSYFSALAIYHWILGNLPDLKKLICHIPECFEDIVAFTEKMGFTRQGYNEGCFLKDGLIGVIELGISDDKIRDLLAGEDK